MQSFVQTWGFFPTTMVGTEESFIQTGRLLNILGKAGLGVIQMYDITQYAEGNHSLHFW